MIELDQFIENDVRGNLLRDLTALQYVEVTFPVLMTACAGVELLGGLLAESEFKPYRKGAAYFSSYWSRYLYPRAEQSALSGIIYELVRNGLAHGFVLKGAFAIGRRQPQRHLTRSGGVLFVDVVQLASDVVESFHRDFEPLLAIGNSKRATIYQRYGEMRACYQEQALHEHITDGCETIDSARESSSRITSRTP
jgi:hypothetical protein